MKLNQNNNDEESFGLVEKKYKVLQIKDTKNIDYLYPNGHRLTPQMRWFKGSRDRCFRSDIAA